jgi:KDO2-lipid IV(A) lauroyltransferase
MSWGERRDLALYRILRTLPAPIVSRVGASLGQVLGRRAHPMADARVAAAIRQLRPDLASNPNEVESARTRLWGNVGRVYAEFCVLHRIVPQGRATIDDPGTLDAVLGDGRPVIVPYVHLGNWETIAIQLADRAPGRLGGLAAPHAANRVRAQIAAGQRGRLAVTVLTVDSNVWRRAVLHLEKPGGLLFVAVDEFTEGRVSTPAVGRKLDPHGNLGKVVRLAARTGALVLPLYSERVTGATLVTHVLSPMEFAQMPKLDPDKTSQRLAQLDAVFAPVILRLIDQWFGLLEYR